MEYIHVGNTYFNPDGRAYWPLWFQEQFPEIASNYQKEKKKPLSAYMINLIIEFLSNIENNYQFWGIRGRRSLGGYGSWIKPEGLCAKAFHDVPTPHANACIKFCIKNGWCLIKRVKWTAKDEFGIESDEEDDGYFITAQGKTALAKYEEQKTQEYEIPRFPDGHYYSEGEDKDSEYQVSVKDGLAYIKSPKEQTLIEAIKCCRKVTDHCWRGKEDGWAILATEPSIKAVLKKMEELDYTGSAKQGLKNILVGKQVEFVPAKEIKLWDHTYGNDLSDTLITVKDERILINAPYDKKLIESIKCEWRKTHHKWHSMDKIWSIDATLGSCQAVLAAIKKNEYSGYINCILEFFISYFESKGTATIEPFIEKFNTDIEKDRAFIEATPLAKKLLFRVAKCFKRNLYRSEAKRMGKDELYYDLDTFHTMATSYDEQEFDCDLNSSKCISNVFHPEEITLLLPKLTDKDIDWFLEGCHEEKIAKIKRMRSIRKFTIKTPNEERIIMERKKKPETN
jgi:hypothetical protein